jgi:hypothetical protein
MRNSCWASVAGELMKIAVGGEIRTYDSSSVLLVLDRRWALYATVSRPESWKVYIAFTAICKSSDANALGLQVLEGARDIQEALAATGHNGDGCPAQLCQISRDVHARLSAAVDASQSAGSKNLDARQLGEKHGACNGCAAIEVLARQAQTTDVAEISPGQLQGGGLAGRLGESDQLFGVQAYACHAVDDTYGCGDTAIDADHAFEERGEGYVLGVWEACNANQQRHAQADSGHASAPWV